MATSERNITASSAESARRFNRLQSLHEILFALNVSYTIMFGLLSDVAFHDYQWNGSRGSDLGYFLRRSAIRLDDFLHIAVGQPVSANFVARRIPEGSATIGAELLIVLSVMAGTLLLLSLLRLTAGSAFHRAVLNPIAGVVALFALPATYLSVLGFTWPAGGTHTFRQDVRPAIFAAEVFVLILLAVLFRKRWLSLWATESLVLLHCTFWILVSRPEFVAFPIPTLLAPIFLLAAFPLSATTWLLFRKALRTQSPRELLGDRAIVLTALSILSAALLFVLWTPARARTLDRSERLDSITIRLSRGPCFGSCPTYTVTVRGTGSVDYEGRTLRSDESVVGHSTLDREQIRQILRLLDGVHFSSLEGRAFLWCFDTPSVAISVSVDGRTKEVVSDWACDGSKLGVQHDFGEAAKEIDSIIGTQQWVKRY
jgi:hypothetical protein